MSVLLIHHIAKVKRIHSTSDHQHLLNVIDKVEEIARENDVKTYQLSS